VNRPGHVLDALALEVAYEHAGRHTLFARAERVDKDELFAAPDPGAGVVFRVGEVTAGWRWDFAHLEHAALGAGVAATFDAVPRPLRPVYGRSPGAVLAFARATLR